MPLILGFIIIICSIVYLVYVLTGQDKKSEDSTNKKRGNSFTCDFVDGPESYRSATVSFLGNGQFTINENPYKANFPFVQDIGMSRDNLYDRISAGDWLFYVCRGEGTKLLQSLNDERTEFVRQSIATIPRKDFKKDYLLPGMAVLDVPLIFNIQGVSHDYQANTRDLISKMYTAGVLELKYWPDAPDDDHRVCVFDQYSHQIGYLPRYDNDALGEEVLKQLEFGISYTARILEKGIVQDTDIWWCKAELTLKAPYPQDSEMVFSSGLGGVYHCRRGCYKAEEEIPMYWAEKCRMTPCKRCHKTSVRPKPNSMD